MLRIRGAITDVAARKRAGMQDSQLRHTVGGLQRQARQAVAAGREELARQALALRMATLAHAGDVRAGQAALRADVPDLLGELAVTLDDWGERWPRYPTPCRCRGPSAVLAGPSARCVMTGDCGAV